LQAQKSHFKQKSLEKQLISFW